MKAIDLGMNILVIRGVDKHEYGNSRLSKILIYT